MNPSPPPFSSLPCSRVHHDPFQAVIQPGLSFKDQKRDTDVRGGPVLSCPALLMRVTLQAVTEPQRGEEANPSLQAASTPEEAYSQSRQHDHFACEGPGLASMLRKLGSGLAMPTSQLRSRTGLGSFGTNSAPNYAPVRPERPCSLAPESRKSLADDVFRAFAASFPPSACYKARRDTPSDVLEYVRW